MAGTAQTLPGLWAAHVGRSPGSPFVTMYDAATGERAELSAATTDNWVAKTANLFASEWGLARGDRLLVDMPLHWQTVVVLLGAWTAGLVVHTEQRTAGLVLDGAVIAVDSPSTGRDCGQFDRLELNCPVLASALAPLGGPFRVPLPVGWQDFALEVPPQPDVLLAPTPVEANDPGWSDGSDVVGQSQLVARGSLVADRIGLTVGGRLLADVSSLGAPSVPVSGLDAVLLAPLVAGGSVVLLRHSATATPADLARLAAQERVTATWPPRSD